MSEQSELFPFASPETVLAMCRRIEAKVLKIAPEIRPEDCMRLIGELSLATIVCEALEDRIRLTPEWVHRHSLDVVPKVVPITSVDVDQRLSWRWTRRRRRNTPSCSSS
jgi:hypothetical protein